MTSISNSKECFHPDLDIFCVPPTNTSVEKGNWIEINTTTTTNNGIIEFHHPGSEHYIHLSETDFYCRVKIEVNDNNSWRPIKDTDKVGITNNFLHSIFSQVDVSIGNLTIENSNKLYPYKAYITNLLNHDDENKQTDGLCHGWSTDTSGQFNNLNLEPLTYSELDTGSGKKIKLSDLSKTNPTNFGFLKRRDWVINSKSEVEMIGKLNSDLFNSNRYLLNNVPFTVKMTVNDSKFALLYDKEADCRFTITSAVLLPRIAKISPQVNLAHLATLEKYTMKYPIKRIIVKSNLINQGVTEATINFSNLSSTPNRIVFGMVLQSASTGTKQENPFEFKHFDLSSISVDIGGQARPFSKSLDLNFEENRYIRPYYALSEHVRKPNKGHGIKYEDFKGGSALFVYDLTPDLISGDCFNLIHRDNLAITLRFSKPTPSAISGITLMESDNIIEGNKDLLFSCDYRI